MSFTNYANLIASINGESGWLHRTYSTDKLDEFIALAEARINEKLRVRQMEAALASTSISAGLITRPTDAVAFKALWSDSNRYPPVEQKSLEFVLQNGSDGSVPQFYAWDRTFLRFNTQSGSVAGVYYQAVPALSSGSPTNWLLTARPDIYLAAIAAEAYQYSRDVEAPNWIAKSEALMEEMNTRDANRRMSGNSLVVRVA